MRGISLLLKPLSWLYGLILWVRHQLYDRGFFFSKTFDQPIIKIGNLCLGGSGKTPMTIFLANHLSNAHNVYILSRGYGRNTMGILEVLESSHYRNVGDEPLMMKKKLPRIRVFVSMDRVQGIQYINQIDGQKKVILLDDSLQHRRLGGGFKILLTDFHFPFFKDDLIPNGKLRDIKSRANSADMVVVTKSEMKEKTLDFQKQLKKYTGASIYFSGITYLPYKNYFTNEEIHLDNKVLVISAIADPKLFIDKVKSDSIVIQNIQYKDHYKFVESDICEWIKICQNNKLHQMVVTEKDAIKLIEFEDIYTKNAIVLVVLPIEPFFEAEKVEEVLDKIELYIKEY